MDINIASSNFSPSPFLKKVMMSLYVGLGLLMTCILLNRTKQIQHIKIVRLLNGFGSSVMKTICFILFCLIEQQRKHFCRLGLSFGYLFNVFDFNSCRKSNDSIIIGSYKLNHVLKKAVVFCRKFCRINSFMDSEKAMLTDLRQHLRSHPFAKCLGFGFARKKNKVVESRLVDNTDFLPAAKGVNSTYPLFIIVKRFQDHTAVRKSECLTNVFSYKKRLVTDFCNTDLFVAKCECFAVLRHFRNILFHILSFSIAAQKKRCAATRCYGLKMYHQQPLQLLNGAAHRKEVGETTNVCHLISDWRHLRVQYILSFSTANIRFYVGNEKNVTNKVMILLLKACRKIVFQFSFHVKLLFEMLKRISEALQKPILFLRINFVVLVRQVKVFNPNLGDFARSQLFYLRQAVENGCSVLNRHGCLLSDGFYNSPIVQLKQHSCILRDVTQSFTG